MVLALSAKDSFSQHSSPDSIEALFISGRVNFDGNPDESVWQSAMHIKNFTQRELNFGEPASERTEAAILYDNDNLYIGVWCYQHKPEKIVAKFMQRDFDYENDDVFGVLISPFNDGRNGYLFIINPNAARADVQVSWENDNIDWNGVWDAKTTITEKGWFAEIQIPFNTLQFRKTRQNMGYQLRRISVTRMKKIAGDGVVITVSNLQCRTPTGIKNIGMQSILSQTLRLGGFEKKSTENELSVNSGPI
jgi:hypothetical protein